MYKNVHSGLASALLTFKFTYVGFCSTILRISSEVVAWLLVLPPSSSISTVLNLCQRSCLLQWAGELSLIAGQRAQLSRHTLSTPRPTLPSRLGEHHKRWDRKNQRVRLQAEMLWNAVSWTRDGTHEHIPSEPAQEQTSRHSSLGLRRGLQGPSSSWRGIESWWLLRRDSQFSSRHGCW